MNGNIMKLAKRTSLSPLRLPVGLFTDFFAAAATTATEKEGLYGKVNDMAITPKPMLLSVPRPFEFRLKRPAKNVV